MIEEIKHQNLLLAILIRNNYQAEGVHFFTPNDYSQQLAYINHPRGHIIQPHIHNPVFRSVHFTKEVLFIKLGKVRVDFYDNNKIYLESRVLTTGDVILLAYGGHGFQMLEASEIIEVKQGPYVGDQDKTRFNPIQIDQIFLKDS